MKFKVETTKTLILFAPKTLYKYLETFGDWSFEFPISDFLRFRKTITDNLANYLDENVDWNTAEKEQIKNAWVELNTITHQNEFDQVFIRRQI